MAKRSYVPDDGNDPEDAKILQEAKDRFRRTQDYESDFHRLYLMDVKFCLGDSDNGWQWPDDLRRDREVNKRPALTINKTARLVSMITNDARQNKPSVSIKPTGNESSYQSAQIFEGLVRDIEYRSNAQNIYDDAMDSAVEGGIGYFRVSQKYVDDGSFDQELCIEPVKDHLGVYLDPDIMQKDGSDSLFGFIFDEEPRDEFERRNPKVNLDRLGTATGLNDADSWVRDDYVRVAEYYRICEESDELFWVEDDKGQTSTFKASEAHKGYRDTLLPGKLKSRKIINRNLEWFKIAGNTIIDRRCKDHNPLKGRYIPIIRVVGIERVIEGRLERKGFVRGLKDAQRMYNYNTSCQTEGVALQTKTPWVGPAAAFAGNEVAWNNANRSNAAYLTYKHMDADGNPLPAPQRLEPPQSIDAFIKGMQIADNEMSMIGGQENAQLGKDGNEKSGKAISERQRQADTATYLYVNNLALAIRYLGRIIIDLVPYIYDTQRVIQILGKDGEQSKVTVDPQAQKAIEEKREGEITNVLFNPNVGKYEVESDVGPAYATQRQEAWNAFVQITTGAPALIDEIGDLMFRSADFPLADKIAERLRRKIAANAPYLLEDGSTTPQLAQLTENLKQAQGQVGELIQKLAEKNLELKNKDDDSAIRRFEADSKRLTAETNSIVDMQSLGMQFKELQTTIMQTLHDMRQNTLENVPDRGNADDGNSSSELIEENDIPPFMGAVKQNGTWVNP